MVRVKKKSTDHVKEEIERRNRIILNIRHARKRERKEKSQPHRDKVRNEIRIEKR